MAAIFYQTFRSFTASKLDLALRLAKLQHPKLEITLIQPGPKDAVMFLLDSMDLEVRAQIAQFGYEQTSQLLGRTSKSTECV